MPGAKGNKNAQKHGFYSKLYTLDEAARLRQDIDMDDEQKLLRTKAYRLAKKLDLNGNLDETELKAMNTLSIIIQTINTLERTKLLARGHGGEIGKTILEALMELDPYDNL